MYHQIFHDTIVLSVKFEGGISTIALLEKIREVINKRIQEKKKNEFTDLAPIDDIENGAEYLKALHWAIKKKKVKNKYTIGRRQNQII